MPKSVYLKTVKTLLSAALGATLMTAFPHPASAEDAPNPLSLKANLAAARGVQIKVNLTLVSRDGTHLAMYTLKHTGEYNKLLKGDHKAIINTITENPWVANEGSADAQQVIYPRFQLAPVNGSLDSLTAVIANGDCKLALKINGSTVAQDGTIHIHLAPAGNLSSACMVELPKLQEITTNITPQAYEYYPPSSSVPAIFELKGNEFAISSNSVLMPKTQADLGIYRDTLSVQGTKFDEPADKGVTLSQSDIVTQATLFSGFALLGQEGYTEAVKSQSYPYTFAWLDDLAKSRSYFSDGKIYRNRHGQKTQWVYYPNPTGKQFTVSEMTFIANGELKELCRFPMDLDQVSFQRHPGEVPAINLTYKAPDLANSNFCKNEPIASYPSSLHISLTPEVLDPARINQVLGLPNSGITSASVKAAAESPAS